jgi:uncharacterized protein YegP (UPF0339 family)
VNNSRSRIRIEIYRGGREGNEQWYWRARRRRNRKIVADGAEGYYKKGNAIRAANTVLNALYDDLLTLDGGPEIVVLDA